MSITFWADNSQVASAKSLINNVSQGCSNLDTICLNQYYRAIRILQEMEKKKKNRGWGIHNERLGDIVPFGSCPKV